mmetsp:Transcript_2126/g.8295  ORF Transcript_2126/g.8295 Transcript_2126/m.8295 type:complete len:348 (+) Transcript_2126:522-1565(+)
MRGYRPHTFLVVGQGDRALARGQVPQPNRAIHGAADELRLRGLGLDVAHRVRVAAEHKDGHLGAHVPNPNRGVSAARGQDVERRVQGEAVHTTEVAMVVSDDHVLLQVPALHLAILGGREHVWVPVRDGEPTDRANVPGQRDLQRTTSQVPDLDKSVVARGGEPLVGRVHGHRPDPTLMARHDAHQLPRSMPFGLRNLVSLHPGRDHHGRGGVALTRRLHGHDGPDFPVEASRPATLVATSGDVRQHPCDGVRLGLPRGIVGDGGHGEEGRQAQTNVVGLLGHIPDMLVLVVHLHAQQHLGRRRVLGPSHLVVADEHVVRPLQRPPGRSDDREHVLRWCSILCRPAL